MDALINPGVVIVLVGYAATYLMLESPLQSMMQARASDKIKLQAERLESIRKNIPKSLSQSHPTPTTSDHILPQNVTLGGLSDKPTRFR